MTLKWRISILAFQLLLLTGATTIVTGAPVANQIWFFSGLLAIVINPQLLEPYYPRPADVIANSIICLALYLVSKKTIASYGWHFFALLCIVVLVLALISVVLGQKQSVTTKSSLAHAATVLSRHATAVTMYSALFWLSVIEYSPNLTKDFWILIIAWALIILAGKPNWQILWSTARGKPVQCKIEGMIGPSVLLISAPDLPPPSTIVKMQAANTSSDAIILTRINRATDVWGQVHLNDRKVAQDLLRKQMVSIEPTGPRETRFIGSVDEASSHERLRFIATKPHNIGDVVAVPNGDAEVLYQLGSAIIKQSNVKGGSHLVVEATAAQLGIFDIGNQRLNKHKWVPDPGAPVLSMSNTDNVETPVPPDNSLHLGNLIGTKVPINLDLTALRQGHLAILGMTRMGKTTFAVRLTRALSVHNRATILDQTGEYIGKCGFDRYQDADDDKRTGCSVIEPPAGSVAADVALKYLQRLVGKAGAEYRVGEPNHRILIIDEAHQFIPEPAGLGFNAPGRDSAYQFGLLMMQVRKYGIAIILISQRTAVVAKSALSQCENVLAFKSVDQTGLDYFESVLGSNARDMLPLLSQGQALAFGPSISADTTVGIALPKA